MHVPTNVDFLKRSGLNISSCSLATLLQLTSSAESIAHWSSLKRKIASASSLIKVKTSAAA